MTWVKDTAERVIVTFLEAWLGAWVVVEGTTVDELFDSTVLMVGVAAAVAALLKALAATRAGNPESASLFE